MTAIEYIKTKHQYELFANQYGQVKFPLAQENQEQFMKVENRAFNLSKQLLKIHVNTKNQLGSMSLS